MPNNQALLAQIADRFREAKFKLGVVESCTGGGLGAAITSLPRVSDFFEGGIVAYSNHVKAKSVYVRESTLQQQGAVSEDCVKEMANGGMVALAVDCCLSVSGIAGPDGGTQEKPVGTVWFGLAIRHKSIQAFHHVFQGDREAIRQQAIEKALEIISCASLKKTV